ncbi:MAG: PQQ-dependent sugar dehydrogenase [Gemmatimonadota bacterium]|nr:PQQ-dependent sugar dehydrogenase [Gemmatimonadota bacterium]
MKSSLQARMRFLSVCGATIVTGTGCGRQEPPSDEPSGSAATTTPSAIRLDTIAQGFEVPWALAFDPGGRIFVTERPGRIRVVEKGVLRAEPWATLGVRATGEAGLMGIALAPDFARSRHVYVVGTFAVGKEDLVNRVVRFTENGGRGDAPTTIVDALPASRFHSGDAIAFGPDGMLYVATGDAQDPGNAQDPGSLAGKILRYKPDGGIPADNPVPGSPIYALGLRNPQGLAWDARTGQLFATDHGPSGFPNERLRRDRDELNAIVAGANYGWPRVTGMDDDSRFVQPLTEWTPAIAPSGLALYSGSYAPWNGNAFVAALKGEQLRRLVLERSAAGWRITGEAPLFTSEIGRIRAVAMGPDGHVYFTTSNRDGRGEVRRGDDMLLRLVAP